MKRFILIPVLAAGLTATVPAVAQEAHSLDAQATDQGAKRGGQFGLDFTVLKIDGKPKGVDNFEIRNLPMSCDQPGNWLLDAEYNLPGNDTFFRVRRGRFNAPAETPDNVVRTTGKFVSKKKVRGRVKARGDFPGPNMTTLTGCEGSRRYVARIGN